MSFASGPFDATTTVVMDNPYQFDGGVTFNSSATFNGSLINNIFGNVWYADSVNGSSSYDGTTAATAVDTIAGAVALASAGDTIFCTGSFSEEVTVSLAGLRIVGVGTGPKVTQWTGDADETCLTIAANYVAVENIYFRPPAYSADATCAAIALSGANWAKIKGCAFQGKTGSYNAIYSAVCNSDNVEISNCRFYYMNTASHGAAILGVEAGGLSYSGWKILNNIFSSCVTAININGRACVLQGNIITAYGINASSAVAVVTTTGIDLSGTSSGANYVVGNYLGGDYSTAVYNAGASGDFWMGNYSDDVAETEVDATGLTVAVPAA